MLFLVSKAWLASPWSTKELHLAHRLNKRLFGVMIEKIPIGELPAEATSRWQVVRLASGPEHQVVGVTMQVTGEDVHVRIFARRTAAHDQSAAGRAHASLFQMAAQDRPHSGASAH
jgi:hypothetical protein